MADNIIREYPPVPESECYYVVDRHKEAFDYPVHTHDEFELNLVTGCRGALRVVGDSIEELPDSDLVFISGQLPHGWLQHKCTSRNIREITLQFSPELFSRYMLLRSPFAPVRELLANAGNGIVFGSGAIDTVGALIEDLISAEESDYMGRFQKFLSVIYALARMRDYRLIVRSPLLNDDISGEESRIADVYEFIRAHYREDIRLSQLADMVGMTLPAFSRFFKRRTGRTPGGFLLETRLAAAYKLLYFTDRSISEICYMCGFGNVSHFCRTFRKVRGCTPSEFRDNSRLTRIGKDRALSGR